MQLLYQARAMHYNAGGCTACAVQLVVGVWSALMSDHWDHTEAWQVQVITLALLPHPLYKGGLREMTKAERGRGGGKTRAEKNIQNKTSNHTLRDP